MGKIVCAGLCEGRHPLPVDEYVYREISSVSDLDTLDRVACDFIAAHSLGHGAGELRLYVTGLTVALVAVINCCCRNGVNLTLLHFDRESGQFFPQPVETRVDCDFVAEGGYSGYSARC